MSKRDEGSLLEEYEKRKFIPEAVRNYLCLLGWSPKDDREILPIEEIIELFDLPAINKSSARFDSQKLAHFNTEYIRKLSIENLAWLSRPVLAEAGVIDEDLDEDYLQDVLAISQEKMRSIENLPEFLGYFFNNDYPIDPSAKEKIFKKGSPKERLQEIYNALSSQSDFSEATLETTVKTLCSENAVGPGDYIMSTRLAISGQGVGPAFYCLLRVLGKERVLFRLKRFIDALSTVGEQI